MNHRRHTAQAVIGALTALACATILLIPAHAADMRPGPRITTPGGDDFGAARLDDGVIIDRTLCANPPHLKDASCLMSAGSGCNDNDRFTLATGVCRLKIFVKNPNDPNEAVHVGTCTGWYYGGNYKNPYSQTYFDDQATLRDDIIVTARHCVDRVIDNCLRTTGNPSSRPNLEEPALPKCVVRVEAEFDAFYPLLCECQTAVPPCADPCSTPNQGQNPPGSQPGSPGLPDPTRPCAPARVWQGTMFGFDFYDIANAPDPGAVPALPDWRNGNADWAVIRITPNAQDYTPGPNQIFSPGLPVNYGIARLGLNYFITSNAEPEMGQPIPIPPGVTPDVFVPQHPRGRCKEFADGPAPGLDPVDSFTMLHRADTEGGSSGSPVCYIKHYENGIGHVGVVGVHYAGGCAPNANATTNKSVFGRTLLVPPQIGVVRIPGVPAGRRPIDWAIRMTQVPKGDLNLDGVIDLADLQIFLWKFGAGRCDDPRYYRLADFNCDGKIDLVDYQYWFAAYQNFINPPLNRNTPPRLNDPAQNLTKPASAL